MRFIVYRLTQSTSEESTTPALNAEHDWKWKYYAWSNSVGIYIQHWTFIYNQTYIFATTGRPINRRKLRRCAKENGTRLQNSRDCMVLTESNKRDGVNVKGRRWSRAMRKCPWSRVPDHDFIRRARGAFQGFQWTRLVSKALSVGLWLMCECERVRVGSCLAPLATSSKLRVFELEVSPFCIQYHRARAPNRRYARIPASCDKPWNLQSLSISFVEPDISKAYYWERRCVAVRSVACE